LNYYTEVPAITGKQLIKLLSKDGWKPGRKATHGITLTKYINGRTKVAFIPDTRASLGTGTLFGILGSKQTGIGREGIINLLNKYGL